MRKPVIFKKPLTYGHMWTFMYENWDGRWVQGGPHHSRLGAWLASRRRVREVADLKILLRFLAETDDRRDRPLG